MIPHRTVRSPEAKDLNTLPRVGRNIGRRWALAHEFQRSIDSSDSKSRLNTVRAPAPSVCAELPPPHHGNILPLQCTDKLEHATLAPKIECSPDVFDFAHLALSHLPAAHLPAAHVLAPSGGPGGASDLDELPAGFDSIDFDVLTISRVRTLRVLAYRLIASVADAAALSVPRSTLWEYVREISVNYRHNPFHNFHHAVSVLHCTHVLLKLTSMIDVLSPTIVLSLHLSALVHDVDHRGRTNLFEINSGSDLAIFYNDVSVLENHHCSRAFCLMQKPGHNVLALLTADQKKEIRATMISFILATDMSKHSEIIEAAKELTGLNKSNALETPKQSLLGKILLHTADLSGPAKPFEIARHWSKLVTAEFNQQVELELKLGLPVLGFMAAGDEKKFLQNEIGFYGFFVAPLLRAVSTIFPELTFINEQLESNIAQLKQLKVAIEETESAPETVMDEAKAAP